MSVRVLSEVFERSESELAARLVLLVLADAAHGDGVTWIPQDEVAAKARVTDRTVRTCLRDLENLGEVETRKAQRGRKRINVYRVRVGYLLGVEVDYDRLPFTLAEPFTTTGEDFRSSDRDDRKSTAATTGSPRARVLRTRQEEPSEPRTSSSGEDDPPKAIRVDGRNVPADVLAEVCGIDTSPRNPRMRGVARVVADLRVLAWEESRRAFPSVTRPADEEEERRRAFEQYVAEWIRSRADAYRRVMPRGAMLTPEALGKWAYDLPRLETVVAETGGARLTAEDVARMEVA